APGHVVEPVAPGSADGHGLAVRGEAERERAAQARIPPGDGAWPPAEFLAGGRVPQADGLVGAQRDERLAVRSEGHLGDLVAVSLAGADLLAGGGVPEPEDLLVAAGGQELTVRGEGDRVHRARMQLPGG